MEQSSFAASNEGHPEEQSAEQLDEQLDEHVVAMREAFMREHLGVATSTKRKEGGQASLAEQIDSAEALGFSDVQFDFRHQSDENVAEAIDTLLAYREKHPDAILSVHGETAGIDSKTLAVKNNERVRNEINLALVAGAESYTMHPPSVSMELFKTLPQAIVEKAFDAYCASYAEALAPAVRGSKNGEAKSNKRFSLALENMNTSGNDGAWGQTPEELLSLAARLEQALIKTAGIEPAEAHAYIGATLDINHALHGTEPERYEEILTRWIEALGDRLKVVHLYAPSEANPDLKRKYDLTINLAARHCPDARIFLESKQTGETTKEVFDALKQ